MAGLAKLLGVRIYELNRSNLFVLFSPQMNFCGLRLGSAFDCFFGRDPWLFPPPRPAPACRVVVAEKSLSGRLSQQQKKQKQTTTKKRRSVVLSFEFILDPGHPAKHVSSLLRAHNRDTTALNCTTSATLETVLQQCGHTEAEVCAVCVCRRRGTPAWTRVPPLLVRRERLSLLSTVSTVGVQRTPISGAEVNHSHAARSTARVEALPRRGKPLLRNSPLAHQ